MSSEKLSYIIFSGYMIAHKMDFFDNIQTNQNKIDINDLFNFNKSILINTDENNYIRLQALHLMLNKVLSNDIPQRRLLSLLIDDWYNSDLHVELLRFKILGIFSYIYADEIEKIFIESISKSSDSEEISEANYQLGDLYLQKAFISNIKNEFIENLSKAKSYFDSCRNTIENRTDSDFFYAFCTTLENFIQNIDISENIEYLFSCICDYIDNNMHHLNPYYLGMYDILKTLNNLYKINPDEWLNYSFEFSSIFDSYLDIKEYKFNSISYNEKLYNNFKSFILDKKINPLLTYKLTNQRKKLKLWIDTLQEGSDQYKFFSNLLLEIDNDKITLNEKDTVLEQLINMFPNRREQYIETLINSYDDLTAKNILSIYEILDSNSLDAFNDKIISALYKLQGQNEYRGNIHENRRNNYVGSLLEMADYMCKDQAEWSVSSTGVSVGEIDLFVFKKNRPYTIVEALNLSSLDKNYIDLHIKKLFKYDVNGYNSLYLVIYSELKKFGSFYSKYVQYINKYTFEYEVIDIQDVIDYDFTDIKILKSKHKRNGSETVLYHIVVNMAKL